MKKMTLSARTLLDNMNLKPMMLAPHYDGLSAVLQEYADVDVGLEEAAWEQRKGQLAASYGLGEARKDKPFAFADGVAIIPVHGVLINRFSYSWGFVTGYNFIRSQYKAALADDDVNLIVFDCNSYGGMVAGCFETSNLIAEGRSKKPSLAVVDSSAYSACYAIASAATKVVSVPSGGAGSIGVVAMHVSVGKMLEDVGIKVSFIYAGKHKVDGHPYADLPEDVRESIQASIDKSYKTFVNSVAAHRNLTVDAVKETEARTYDADDALAIGLIDAVQSPDLAVAAYLNELSGSETLVERKSVMDDKTTTQPGAEGQQPAQATVDTAAIQATAISAERERIAAIIGSEEAQGRTKLAQHLALNTDMSVDAAKATLAVAPTEKPEKAEASGNPFAAAMDGSDNPNIGADGDGAEAAEKSDAARILAAHSAATGNKY